MANYTFSGGNGLVVWDQNSALQKVANSSDSIQINDIIITGNSPKLTVPENSLYLGSTQVTATAAEINKLDGLNVSTAELNYLDISTLGTAEASKAIIVDASSQVDANAITFTNLGTVTTVDINGGTVDGVNIGASTAGTGAFTTLDCSDGAFAIVNLDIDGGTDIGAALVDADLMVVDDGANGTNRKTEVSRLKTYIQTSQLSFTQSNTFENSTGQIFQGDEGSAGSLYLKADQGDDAGDSWKMSVADGGVLTLGNDIAVKDTFVTHMTLTPNATASSSSALFAGSITVNGDLTVNGSTTTLNTATLTVDDLNIVVADGAADGAAADGGGITIDGANASMIWVNANSHLAFNTDVNFITDGIKINGTAVTSTSSELNKLDGATVTTAELNILDGDTAASSITVEDADRLVVNDDGTMKQIAVTTLKTYFQSNVTASSIAADDITTGDGNILLTTSSGTVEITATSATDIVVDAPSGQSVDLQVAGSNVVEVAAGRVDVSQPLIIAGNAGLSLVPAAAHPAFEVGHILSFETGANGGLELSDCDDTATNYLNVPFGVALQTSALNNTNAIMVHTVHGGIANVKIAASTTGQGQWVYLSDTAGIATTTAPTSGMVWRLGIATEHNSSNVTDVDIIWMPQFIADLG